MLGSRGAVRCRRCGARLVDGVRAGGSVLVGDLEIVFRRRTDYVVCSSCLAGYPAPEVIRLALTPKVSVSR